MTEAQQPTKNSSQNSCLKHDVELLSAQKREFFQKQYWRFYSNINPATKTKSRITFYAGPTNSGKTRTALTEIKALLRQNPDAKVMYLTPLRLLAIEVYEKLNSMGIACNLKTGEETIMMPACSVTAATVELFDDAKHDLIVIDEYQMYTHKERGQAWVRALLNANTSQMIVIGADDSLGELTGLYPVLAKLLPQATIDIRYFNRLSKLECLEKPIAPKDFLAGDCLVVFSKKKVLRYAALLHKQGFSVSVLYGDLPLETRRLQAKDFLSGKSDVLVATDVIGMGLNLPIKRIIFETCTKYNGKDMVRLNLSEFKQIAGRAGRGSMTGFFGLLDVSSLFFCPKNGGMIKEIPANQSDISRQALRQTPLITQNINHKTVKLKQHSTHFSLSEFSKNPLRLDINFDFLEEYARYFELSLIEALKDYTYMFETLKLTSGFEILQLFCGNTQMVPQLIHIISGTLGESPSTWQEKINKINAAFDSQLTLRNLMALCTPPIDCRDKMDIHPIGKQYLQLLCLILSAQSLKAQKMAVLITMVDYYANLSVEQLNFNKQSASQRLINDFNDYGQREKLLIVVSWLNKYLALIDKIKLKRARLWFALHLFQMIRSSYLIEQDEIEPMIKQLIAQQQRLRRFFKKIHQNRFKIAPSEQEILQKQALLRQIEQEIMVLQDKQAQQIADNLQAVKLHIKCIADAWQ